MQLSRLIPLALLAAALAALVVWWPSVDAQRRAFVVFSTSIETPVITWAVKVLTGEPRVEETTIAGNATTLVRPSGDGPWPAFVFVNGAAVEGRFQPDVERLARGLARAGYVVFVPDLPGLSRGELTDATLSETLEVTLSATQHADVRNGKVALMGVSVGASLALIAAQDPLLAGRVSVVAGFAPFAALPNVVRLATTGFYLDEGKLKPFDADDYVSLVVARSVLSAMPPSDDRARLLAAIAQMDEGDPKPLEPLRAIGEQTLSADAAAVVRLLTNTHPTIFDSLYSQLPAELRGRIERLSPLIGAAGLQVPVELISGPKDKYFPLAESRALVRILPRANLTVTSSIGNHVIPQPSITDLGGLFAFNGFAVRVLRAARD